MSVEGYTNNRDDVNDKIFTINRLIKKVDDLFRKIRNTKFIKNNIDKRRFYKNSVFQIIKYVNYIEHKNKQYKILVYRKLIYIKLHNMIKNDVTKIKILRIILFIRDIRLNRLENTILKSILKNQNIFINQDVKNTHKEDIYKNKYNFIEKISEFIKDVKFYRIKNKNLLFDKLLKLTKSSIKDIKLNRLENAILKSILKKQGVYINQNIQTSHKDNVKNKYNFIERTREFIENIQFIRTENRNLLFNQLLENIQDDITDIKDTKINNLLVFIRYANTIKLNNKKLKNKLETKYNGDLIQLSDRFTIYKIVRNILHYVKHSQDKLSLIRNKLSENKEKIIQSKQVDEFIDDNNTSSIELSDFNNKEDVVTVKNEVDTNPKIEPTASITDNALDDKQSENNNENKNNNIKRNLNIDKETFIDISNVSQKTKLNDYQLKDINNLNDLSDLVIGVGIFDSKQDFLKIYNENNQQSIYDFIEYMGYCSFLVPNEKTMYFENILKIYFKTMRFDEFFVIGKHKKDLLLDCTIEVKLPFQIIVDDMKFIENFYNQFGLNYLYVTNKKLKLLENPDYIVNFIKANCDVDKDKLIDIYQQNRDYVVKNYVKDVYFIKQNDKIIHYDQFDIDNKDEIKTLISYIELYSSIDYNLCDKNGKKVSINNLISLIE